MEAVEYGRAGYPEGIARPHGPGPIITRRRQSLVHQSPPVASARQRHQRPLRPLRTPLAPPAFCASGTIGFHCLSLCQNLAKPPFPTLILHISYFTSIDLINQTHSFPSNLSFKYFEVLYLPAPTGPVFLSLSSTIGNRSLARYFLVASWWLVKQQTARSPVTATPISQHVASTLTGSNPLRNHPLLLDSV